MLTSTQLVESIKRKANIPDAAGNFTNDKILQIASEELKLGLASMLMKNGYLILDVDVPLEVDRVHYRVHPRAIGSKLKDVKLVRRIGNPLPLNKIPISQKYNFELRDDEFIVDANSIVLSTAPDLQEYSHLRQTIYVSPANLVQKERVTEIIGVTHSVGFYTITVQELPFNITTESKFDIYLLDNPHNVINIDVPILSINRTTKAITILDTDVSSSPERGYLALTNESHIPQVPAEFHYILAQMAAVAILTPQGDFDMLNGVKSKLNKMLKDAGLITSERVTDAPTKVVNRFGLISRQRR